MFPRSHFAIAAGPCGYQLRSPCARGEAIDEGYASIYIVNLGSNAMISENSLSINKPTPVLKKSIKVNFQDFSKALGKGFVDLSFGKWDSLA